MNLVDYLQSEFELVAINLIPGSKGKANFISFTYLSKKGKMKRDTLPCANHLKKADNLAELIVIFSKDDGQPIVCDPTKGRQAIASLSFSPKKKKKKKKGK
jgi:hypothetical protein